MSALEKVWDRKGELFEVPANRVDALVKNGWSRTAPAKDERRPDYSMMKRRQRGKVSDE